MVAVKRWCVFGLAVLALTLALGESSPVAAQPNRTVDVDVRVWQSLADVERLYVSARPAGGSWRELGTVPLRMRLSSYPGYRYGSVIFPVALADAPTDRTAEVEIRVWQGTADAMRFYVSARVVDGFAPGLPPVRLDMSGLSQSGRYRYGDITLAAPDVASPPWELTGKVLGPDGAPMQGPRLFAHAVHVSDEASWGSSAWSGVFTVPLPDGAYRIEVSIVCPQWSGRLGWYEEQSGFTTDKSEATFVVIDGDDVSGIVVRLPAPPHELAPECASGEGQAE